MNKLKTKKSAFSLKEINAPWRAVLHLAEKGFLAKGETLVSKDKIRGNIFFIDKGRITLRTVNTQGKERVSLYLESGCIAGESSPLSLIGDAYSANYLTAIEDCIIYYFPADLLASSSFREKYPDLIYNLLQSVASKSTLFYYLLIDQNKDSALEAVCRYIDRLAESHNADTFAPNLSQNELAISVGVHRSTLCRVLNQLREEGILGKFSMKQIEILNREKLKEYAHN